VSDAAQYWIDTLRLVPHAEGGFFSESYRSADVIAADALPARFGGARPASTAIYFLLTGSEYSALHRLRADEVWHHYAGSSLTLHRILPGGGLSQARLGRPDVGGGVPQIVVPAGCWFGATVDDARGYALVGCTVAPGFSAEDFELGERARLILEYPQHEALIVRLTRPPQAA
jgi:predicted cupin superfamily sugar epimerase